MVAGPRGGKKTGEISTGCIVTESFPLGTRPHILTMYVSLKIGLSLRTKQEIVTFFGASALSHLSLVSLSCIY